MVAALAFDPDVVLSQEPEFGYIPIPEIRYDRQRWEGERIVGYQRELDKKRVQWQIDHYDTALAKPALVNIRADGSIYCIDNQHGNFTEAGRGRSVVFSRILRGLTPQQEADIYWRVNTQRRSLQSTNVFGARVSSGEAKANRIAALAADCGFRAGNTNGSLRDIAATRSLETVADYPDGDRLLRTTLSKVLAIWPAAQQARQGTFIEGLAQFIWTWDKSFGVTTGNSIDWSRFEAKFATISAARIISDVGDLKKNTDTAANPTAYATVLRDLYNGRRDFRGQLHGAPKRAVRQNGAVFAKSVHHSRNG